MEEEKDLKDVAWETYKQMCNGYPKIERYMYDEMMEIYGNKLLEIMDK